MSHSRKRVDYPAGFATNPINDAQPGTTPINDAQSGTTPISDEQLVESLSTLSDAQLEESLSMRAPDGSSFVDVLIKKGRFDLLANMRESLGDRLEGLLFSPKAKVNDSSRSTLQLSLRTLKTKLRETFSKKEEELLKFYIRLFNKHLQPLTFPQPLSSKINLESFLEHLFGPKSVYSALELAAAKFMLLLFNHSQCINYLRFLEREFNRYQKEKFGKVFSKLSENTYDFTNINGYEYPIPNDKFNGIVKCSVFQEYLMVFLRKAGWGNDNTATEWLGFVPNEKANDLLLSGKGAFTTEGRIDIGLFHGKLPHMMQLALAALAIQDEYITGVTLHELIDFLVHNTVFNLKMTLWQRILDSTQIEPVYLGNPYYLHTLIMRHGHGDLAIPSISDHWKDTFCKGFNKLVKYKFQKNDTATKKAYLDELQYWELTGFHNNPDLLKKYVREKKEKYHHIIDQNYGVFKKPYAPNPKFIPEQYHIPAEDAGTIKNSKQ